MSVKCRISARKLMSISVFSTLEMLHLFIKPNSNSLRFCVLSSFRTSLQLCATLRANHNMVLDVCKLGALRCMGRNFVLTSDSDCRWPEKKFTSCEDCQPGTICQGVFIEDFFFSFLTIKSQKQDVYVTGCCIKPLCFLTAEAERKCVCRNASECPKDSTPLCVSSGDGSTHVTTTECEAGARRCAGEQVNVISIDPCQ